AGRVDLQAPEGERYAAANRVGLERGLFHGVGPIALLDGEPDRTLAVLDVRIELDVALHCGVVITNGLEKARRIDVLHLVDELFELIRTYFRCAAHLVLVAQQRKRLCVEQLPSIAARLRQYGTAVLG